MNCARGTDVLVMHMAVPETIGTVGRNLHAPPGVIANIAHLNGCRDINSESFYAPQPV